jgi:hypothetical protein
MERTTADAITKLYAILSWLGALGWLLTGLGLLLGGPILGSLADAGQITTGGTTTGEFLSTLGVTGAVVMFVMALLALAVGVGLWRHSNWARVLTILFAVLSLLAFPIGTVYGIITIWLFGFQDDIKALFGRALGHRRESRQEVIAR